jgi:RimJ/RimL family protein N-acetyltransferase
MRLETERLILRPWEDRDYEFMAEIQGDPQVRRFFVRAMTREEVFTDLDLAIERAALNGFHFQAAELKESGELIGLIGIGRVPDTTRAAIPSHPEVEIGWVLAQRFWGRSLAVEGARAWLDHVWRIGLSEVVAFTSKLNLPSQRVMQKLGMSYRPEDDYEHPSVLEGNPLRPHIVYAIRRPE